MKKKGAVVRGHRYAGASFEFDRARYFGGPEPPKAPPPMPPPEESDAAKASAREGADAAARRGKAATIIAGRRTPQQLGSGRPDAPHTLGGVGGMSGGSRSLLGGAYGRG